MRVEIVGYRRSGSRAFALMIPLVLAACDAGFTDLRPSGLRGVGGSFCAPGGLDGGAVAGGQVYARGTFSGRDGHIGEGGAALALRADGATVVRFDPSFRTSSAPGPVVVLASRDKLGTSIDPDQGDLEIAALDSPIGVQEYVVTPCDGGRRFVFVYCKPYGVEMALAPLMDGP